MSIESIVAIAIDFGGSIHPRTIEVEFIRNRNEVNGKRLHMTSYATMHRLESLTAGWPAFMEIDNRYVVLDRPGYHMTEEEYENALKRMEELMDIELPPEDSGKTLNAELAELLELAKRVESYEHEHYPIDPPDDPNQSWE